MSKEKAIWLIAGGPMQRAVAEEVKRQGYALIVSDRNAACACANLASTMVDLDTFDIPNHLIKADQLRKSWDIRAVITAAADCHETVAHLARHLQVHGLDPEISHICRYKVKSRQLLASHGIPQPRATLVATRDEAIKFCRTLPGKAVLKATNNSGSRGFIAIDSLDELNEGNFQYTLSQGTTGSVIVEEKLHPTQKAIAEQSVETLWYNGRMYWLNWVDRLFRQDLAHIDNLTLPFNYSDLGFAVELGHINPAVHPIPVKEAVATLMHQAGVALGMHRQKGGHLLKADIMLTDQGPVIIELTPRLSGGWDSSLTTPQRGANFVGGMLQLALGKALDLELWTEYFAYRNPSLYAAMLCQIKPGARDSMGRDFFLGCDYRRHIAVENAFHHLEENAYVL